MRVLISLISLLALASCSAVPGVAQVEAASVLGTDKTFTDNLISHFSGKNCSILRANQGLTYCEEDEVLPKPEVYCYKTIGRVTCYDRPDPYQSRVPKVGENDHNYVKRY